jgi:hypothetical protein
MSPIALVAAVFLFLLGFLLGRWALERAPAPQAAAPAGPYGAPSPGVVARARAIVGV